VELFINCLPHFVKLAFITGLHILKAFVNHCSHIVNTRLIRLRQVIDCLRAVRELVGLRFTKFTDRVHKRIRGRLEMFSDSLSYLFQTVLVACLQTLDASICRFPDVLDTRLIGLRQLIGIRGRLEMLSDSLPYLFQTVLIACLQTLDTLIRRFPDVLNTRFIRLRQFIDCLRAVRELVGLSFTEFTDRVHKRIRGRLEMFSDSLSYLFQTVLVACLQTLDASICRFPDVLDTRLIGLRQLIHPSIS
jgi:hypothetical protein